jgi:hypothetical protein
METDMDLAPRPHKHNAGAAVVTYDWLVSQANTPNTMDEIIHGVRKAYPNTDPLQIRRAMTNGRMAGLFSVQRFKDSPDLWSISSRKTYDSRREVYNAKAMARRRQARVRESMRDMQHAGKLRADSAKRKTTAQPSGVPLAPTPPRKNTYNHIIYSILKLYHDEGKGPVSFAEVYKYLPAAVEGTTKQMRTRADFAKVMEATAYHGWIVRTRGSKTKSTWRLASLSEYNKTQEVRDAQLQAREANYAKATEPDQPLNTKIVSEPVVDNPKPKLLDRKTVVTAMVGGAIGAAAVALSSALWS